jgi:hypothetical protein
VAVWLGVDPATYRQLHSPQLHNCRWTKREGGELWQKWTREPQAPGAKTGRLSNPTGSTLVAALFSQLLAPEAGSSATTWKLRLAPDSPDLTSPLLLGRKNPIARLELATHEVHALDNSRQLEAFADWC